MISSLLDYTEEQLPEWESEEYFVVDDYNWESVKQKTCLRVKRFPTKKKLMFLLEHEVDLDGEWIGCGQQMFSSKELALEQFENEKSNAEHMSSHKGLAFQHMYWLTHYKGKLLNAVILIDDSKYVYLHKKKVGGK